MIRIHLVVKYCGSRNTLHSFVGEILGATNYRSIVGLKRDLIGPKDGPGAHFAAQTFIFHELDAAMKNF